MECFGSRLIEVKAFGHYEVLFQSFLRYVSCCFRKVFLDRGVWIAQVTALSIFKNRRLWVEREHNTEFTGSISDPVERLVGRSFCALAELLRVSDRVLNQTSRIGCTTIGPEFLTDAFGILFEG